MNRIAPLCATALLCIAVACNPKPSKAEFNEPPAGQTTSIAQLKLMYRGYPVKIDREIYVRGGIVSSDKMGNFYKNIIIEDSTGGIEVKLDMDNIYLVNGYQRGQTVTILCNTLTIGSYGGALQLGVAPTGQWETDPIPADEIPGHVTCADFTQKPINEHVVDFRSLTPRHVDCWIKFEQVQFIDQEMGLRWGDDALDVDRHLINRSGDTLAVRVRHAGALAKIALPRGSGTIGGVLGYFNGHYQLLPISQQENSMTGQRF